MLFLFLPALKFWLRFLQGSDKIYDSHLPTFSFPFLRRQQGLYNKILMTMDPHNNIRQQQIFNKAMHLLRRHWVVFCKRKPSWPEKQA